MDYTGFSPFKKQQHRLNRPQRKLPEAQFRDALDKKKQASEEPLDWLSVIKVNSTYMELVDRWYPIRGWMAWIFGIIFLLCLVAVVMLIYIGIVGNEPGAWAISIVFLPIFAALAYCGYLGIRYDMFHRTHYPIRLNRKTRKIYVMRPLEEVLEVSWDDLFLCVQENRQSLSGRSYDVRAYVFGEDGETVQHMFTLAYANYGDRAGLMRLWEFVRRYMEEPNGSSETYEHMQKSFCLPISNRYERPLFGVMMTFAGGAKWPILQLLGSPLWALNTLGRWLAMYTCKVPVWPKAVDDACAIDRDDPYQRDWNNNTRFSFMDREWPIICFLIGLGVLIYIGYLIAQYTVMQ